MTQRIDWQHLHESIVALPDSTKDMLLCHIVETLFLEDMADATPMWNPHKHHTIDSIAALISTLRCHANLVPPEEITING